MGYSAKILADSINSHKIRITTFEVSYPRIVLAEANTHRVFSRNYSSSRAIPNKTFIQNITNDPFIPVYWGLNQKGMVAEQELTLEEQKKAEKVWLEALDSALIYANKLAELGVHKQITNRILEPWMYCTGIITATTFSNFFNLRCHPDAQPEIRKIAELMREEFDSSKPKLLLPEEWHIPLVNDEDRSSFSEAELIKISTGRCARVSYLTHDGVRNPKADLELHDRLLISKHLSPFEHCAQNMEFSPTPFQYYGNFIGWKQYRKYISNESGED